MTRPRPHPGLLILLALFLFGAVVLAYANHFDNDFHFDDKHVIVQNTSIRDLDNIPDFFTDAMTNSTLPTNRAYRPVLMVTFAIDYALGDGLDPFFFHLSTFIWFLVQGLLMYVVYVRLLDASRSHRWNPYVAVGIVGLYLLHTTNAETINYISARSDSLSTLCVVAAFAVERRRSWWRTALAAGLMAVGILIKPPALMFVPLLFFHRLLFEWRPRPSNLWREVLPLVSVAIVGIAFFLLTQFAQSDTWVPGGTSRWGYLITQPFVLLRYFWLFFVPVGLSADTDWTVLGSVTDWRFFAGAAFIVVALGTAAVAARWRSGRPITFGLLWFFFALAPSSSIIPLSEVTNDHRMFFPYVGLVLAVGWSMALLVYRYEATLLVARWRLVMVIGLFAAVLAAHTYGVHERNVVWQDSTSLWYDVTQQSPGNGRGHMNYGLALMRAGDMTGAEACFRRAIDTPYGRHPYLAVNLGITSGKLGRPEEAERYFQRALEGAVTFPEVHYYYAKWIGGQGRVGEAMRHLDLVLERSPAHADSQAYRDELMSSLGSRIAALEREVASDATRDALINLSLEYYRSGRYEDCIRACRASLELKADDVVAFNNLCSAYIAMEHWDDAVAACERAIEIDPTYERAQNNLREARRLRGTD